MPNKFFSQYVFILLLPLLFSGGLNAQMSEIEQTPQMPIEWQAIKLQESIENKIVRSLNPIIGRNDYVIEVKIGFDAEKADDPSSKKVTKTIQKTKIKFSVSEMPKDGDDFVVFNKLGLDAPIVGDEPVEMQTSEIEQAQKAMIEMNDRFNLFKFLTTIDIKLTFDKNLSPNTKANIQKIISGLSFNTKDVIPQINIQYLDLLGSKVKVIDPNSKGDSKTETKTPLSERFRNLDIMIGMILAAIILGITAFLIAKIGSKVKGEQENKNEEMAPIQEEVVAQEDKPLDEELPVEENTDEVLEEDDMALDLTKTDAQTAKINEGLERFHKAMNNHYNDAVLMIKNWIKVGKGKEAEALKALVEVLTDPELKDIFKALTLDERSTWKMCLDGEMNREQVAKAFIFISHQVINMMMVPSLIDDYEVCDLLLDLSPEDAASFCMKHRKLGMIFVNVLSASTISEMFKIMPYEVVAQIIEESSVFRKEEVLAQMPLLKEKLMEIKSRRERPPFVKRIVDILPNARPEIERNLYGTLLKYLMIEDVRDIAVKVIPTEVVSNLPDSLFKESISSMPLDFQVQYFVSLGDEREKYLGRFASKGSKAREMIDVEMSGVLKNDLLVRRLTGEKKARIQSEFVEAVRRYLASHPEAQKEASSATLDWLHEVKKEVSVSFDEAA
ncbi:MAG: hypothetical protein KBD76_14080 [Bacteriovorax sp.]|nr:hypothetical protein [Bacteriovorax sp.]